MRRLLVGVGWCVALWMSATMVGGMLAGVISVAAVDDPAAHATMAREAGFAFGARYGNLALLASLAISAVGTLTGWLPGTRARAKEDH